MKYWICIFMHCTTHQRATNLQPLDKRMWQAIGNCYEKIDQLEEAFKSFAKALSIGK